MTPIESGPTTERRVRTALFFLMFAVFAGWFAKDGWIGYPDQNFREHLEDLPPELRDEAAAAKKVYDSVTKESIEQTRKALNKFDAQAQRKALEDLFDGPPSYETKEALYYFGLVYRVRIDLSKNGKLKSPAIGRLLLVNQASSPKSASVKVVPVERCTLQHSSPPPHRPW